MYCSKCGSENSNENLFCEKCGAKLVKAPGQKDLGYAGTGATGAGGSGTKNKKVIAGIIAAVLVVVVCIVAVVIHMGDKTSPEYNAKIQEADRYLEQMEYEKAETAYLEAIDIEPKVDDAYLKLADVYVVQEKYEEAVEILQKGEENAGGKDIEEKLAEVMPYDVYYEYLDETVIPEIGMAPVDETYSRDYYDGGLMSALIKDIDGDEIPEMITLAYGTTRESQITISCYTCQDGEVSLASEFVESGLTDESLFAAQYEFLLKEHEGDVYLMMYGDQIYHMEGGGDRIEIYHITKDAIDRPCELIASASMQYSGYLLNGETVAEYMVDDIPDYDENAANAAAEAAFSVFQEQLAGYGLEKKAYMNEYGNIEMYGFDAEEPSETIIAYIQLGGFDGYGVDYTQKDDIFVEDYTLLRDKLQW